ncbi:nucleotide-diphospho-sugar transferase [Auriculariales sp. MPI-PUGE-AT-0066]|nr:nucleotide-diphospho-sugar transferase [Auriculariales sp. MPI-PUGE-AT-0066]
MNTAMPVFEFTASQDWFSGQIEIWKPLIDQLCKELPGPARALEIGSWEGRSAVFLLQSLCFKPGSRLVCIDHFDVLRTEAGNQRFAKLQRNLSLAAGENVEYRVMDEFSVPALYKLLEEEVGAKAGGYDFIYIDGSHEADDTFLDAELAWRLARAGATIVFDDYEWKAAAIDSIHHPKRGIDAFMKLHEGQFQVLHRGYQIILRKRVAQRIGFFTKAVVSAEGAVPSEVMNYGINLALCIDNAYAMAAAVTIRSAVISTPGIRISVYLIDCGVSQEARENITASIPEVQNEELVTIVWLTLPKGSRGMTAPTWAKTTVVDLVPVERVLYLDADILVRHSLEPLWRTDLRGRSLGAVRDIGYPLGHDGVERQPYFNAGVMLLDLARIRVHAKDFRDHVSSWGSTTFKDQDALAAYFADDWEELDLAWNATGLGTYARWSSPDRDSVWAGGELEKLHADPHIVHFTGPVHPTMASVLNEHVQPWISKPWGYSGCPEHPFANEWWDVCEGTAWRGYRKSQHARLEREAGFKAAMEKGCRAFEAAIAVTST